MNQHENPSSSITAILESAAEGDANARERLLERIYHELHTMASRMLSKEADAGTVQATMLVHDAWFRLMGESEAKFTHRGHFFGAAATAMRRILVEAARRRQAHKRGGHAVFVTLSDIRDPAVDRNPDVSVLRLHEALACLEDQAPDLAKLVELRYFAGLTIEETATALGRSIATVKREWSFARAWLHDRMERESHDDHD